MYSIYNNGVATYYIAKVTKSNKNNYGRHVEYRLIKEYTDINNNLCKRRIPNTKDYTIATNAQNKLDDYADEHELIFSGEQKEIKVI